MIEISPLEEHVGELSVEVAERKGLGHPDTICDALAEEFSRALCRFYLDHFGFILHHNVDKGLLFAGRARPAFGGGEVLEPIEIFLTGRATLEYKGTKVPVEDLAHEAAEAWFRRHFHALDPQRHIRLKLCVRPGSAELVDLFLKAQKSGTPLANDTSIGVGFAPLSPLEELVLTTEKFLNDPSLRNDLPALGQDIKVMGIREGQSFRLTVACAMVDRFLPDLEAYLSVKEKVQTLLLKKFSSRYPDLEIRLNTADDPQRGDIYLTVTGTSAEAGDDGEVGRGNRVNGLITPLRPMSLEAAAGKNPVNHVGKIYNLFAPNLCQKLVQEIPTIREASLLLVSRIGYPITDPQMIFLRLRVEGDFEKAASQAREMVLEELKTLPSLWKKVITGELSCY
ncbi:MAG: methionine adenosyltransferase [Thermodesulfobacteria bacterium]|nr:methionine adenosyltransferase [Thermodesulfobacteriota bacterium]